MHKKSISYQEAKMLAPITRMYLDNNSLLDGLFIERSEAETVQKVIDNRAKKLPCDRTVLVNVLESQYAGLKISKKVKKNFNLLKEENTYTITTGHQLNLFTGPLYFIYKIFSAIKTAEALSAANPQQNFVPVYWMATEDHDFEEINHAFIKGERLDWETNQTGMVGEFTVKDFQPTLDKLQSVLGDSHLGSDLFELINQSYAKGKNLSEATRYLVNELFQSYGLVIVDGNDAALKKQFAPIVREELKNQVVFEEVNKTLAQFPPNISEQVTPREINLFYVIPGIRERIIADGKGFQVNNTELKFSAEEIENELENHPERFSPNALMRPIFQEVVLPNVQYIGGGAEVAYWLELKSAFERFNVSYPQLQIRSAFVWLSNATGKKMNELNLSELDLFTKYDELVRKVLDTEIPFEDKIAEHKLELDRRIGELISDFESYDPALVRTLKSTKTGFLKELKRLDKKLYRSVKAKNNIKLKRLDAIMDDVYPSGSFQERRVNFLEMILTYGWGFMDEIYKNTEPFATTLSVLSPEK